MPPFGSSASCYVISLYFVFSWGWAGAFGVDAVLTNDGGYFGAGGAGDLGEELHRLVEVGVLGPIDALSDDAGVIDLEIPASSAAAARLRPAACRAVRIVSPNVGVGVGCFSMSLFYRPGQRIARLFLVFLLFYNGFRAFPICALCVSSSVLRSTVSALAIALVLCLRIESFRGEGRVGMSGGSSTDPATRLVGGWVEGTCCLSDAPWPE